VVVVLWFYGLIWLAFSKKEGANVGISVAWVGRVQVILTFREV